MNFSALLYCVVYLALLGLASQFIGMSLPRDVFTGKGFWFRCRTWEKGGKIYEKLGVRHWKDSVPDMSKLFKKSMVAKQIKNGIDYERAVLMLKETCVAELIHILLALFAFPCLFIWRGAGGAVVWFIYALGNTVFVIIQRYNRPRYEALIKRLAVRKQIH
ncbi:MAG: glycosyl-4,4'-diaponeurosporenoate acyltransferase [Ruminococcaceae bacterium]|nr:glycosyl-4,4'-diaponeurosporenoate acyltransferase [Oscillospiraceae bacterium]